MSNNGDNFRRVTKAAPCPVCGKADACKVSIDGAVAMCKRVEMGSFRAAAGGWHFHRLHDNGRDDWKRSRGNGALPKSTPAPKSIGKVFATADDAIEAARKTIPGAVLAGVWIYEQDGKTFKVARFNLSDGEKVFRPCHCHKGKWKIGDPAKPLWLYRLAAVANAPRVYVCEGEKATDCAVDLGLTATTSAHGSGSAAETNFAPIAFSEVVILRDNDPPGEHYGRDVARCIFAINPAAKVKIVLLPGLPEGGDIVEFVEARDVQAPEEIRAEVDALADAVPWLNASDIIGGPVFKTLSDVQPQAVRWLWPYRIPMGKLTMVVGDPGLGKSYLSLYIAAAVTRGLTWPDDDQSAAPIGDVILLSAEDGDDDTIRPRADAAAADVRRVHLLEGVTHIDPDTGRPSLSLFNLERDISNLEIGLRRWPATRIVIIDPVSAYCGKTDSHKNADVRALTGAAGRDGRQAWRVGVAGEPSQQGGRRQGCLSNNGKPGISSGRACCVDGD